MSEWQETTLGDMITLQRGHDLAKTEMQFGSIPVAGSNGIIGYHDKATTKALGITIGRSGNIGNPHLYKEDFWAHNTTLYVKDFKGNDEIYVYYLLKSIDFAGFNVGSAVPTLNRNHIHPMAIQKPSREEQRAIASVLSSLDDKIDLLHRQNTTLERMAETLFRQWFVEESQSFDTGKIGALIEGTFGGDWGKEAPEGDFTNAVNCIRGTDIADLQTGLAKKIPLRFVSTKKLQSIEPKNGDIIFEISGGTETQSTGRATYINDDVRSLFAYPLVFSNFCRLLRPLNTTYSYFIYLYLSYLYEQDEFFGLENGSSGIKNLNYKALFFELDYPMPPLNRVQEFNNLVTPSFSKINQNKKQIQTLEKLRDNLLPQLMSGEVRVELQGTSQ